MAIAVIVDVDEIANIFTIKALTGKMKYFTNHDIHSA